MQYAAIAVAILGCAVGATFRLRFLLGVILLVLAISLVFSLSHGSGLWDKVLIILVPQAVLQGGYFVGLVSRGFFSFVQRKLSFARGEAEQLRRQQDG
jgi:hypothetical protein